MARPFEVMGGVRHSGDGRFIVELQMIMATQADAENFSKWLQEAIQAKVKSAGGSILPMVTSGQPKIIKPNGR